MNNKSFRDSWGQHRPNISTNADINKVYKEACMSQQEFTELFEKLCPNNLVKRDYLECYERIFQICSAFNFNHTEFFHNFITAVKPYIKRINTNLPGPWQIIAQHLSVPDLIKLRKINQEFRQAIPITTLNFIKTVNNLMAYFNRAALKNNKTILLANEGLLEGYEKFCQTYNVDNYVTVANILRYLLVSKSE